MKQHPLSKAISGMTAQEAAKNLVKDLDAAKEVHKQINASGKNKLPHPVDPEEYRYINLVAVPGITPELYSDELQEHAGPYAGMVNLRNLVEIAILHQRRMGIERKAEIESSVLYRCVGDAKNSLNSFEDAVLKSDPMRARMWLAQAIEDLLSIAGKWEIPLEEDLRRYAINTLSMVGNSEEAVAAEVKELINNGTGSNYKTIDIEGKKCYPIIAPSVLFGELIYATRTTLPAILRDIPALKILQD